MSSDSSVGDLHDLERISEAYQRIRQQIGQVVLGQEQVVELLLACIFARGHCILEGVPGLAKTLLVSTLARSLSLKFSRIQFTPDLMPSDITGTQVMQEDRGTGARQLTFVSGPIFANIVLGDEINRTPPKTQAALLEGMQERQVTAGGERFGLPEPFFVLATQNPIEQEGTYPLPEAQLDRFLIKVFVDYPSVEEEKRIYRITHNDQEQAMVRPVLGAADIIALQHIVQRVPLSDYCLDYALRLVRATRGDQADAPEFIRQWVSWGCGPRGGQALISAARARAALHGRPEVQLDDIQAMAKPTLRHRLVLNYNAQAQGQSPDMIIDALLESVTPSSTQAHHGQVQRALKP